MFIVYENSDDENKLHIGQLLTSNITEHTTYVDVIPKGDIVHKELDWKKSHISSVNMDEIIGGAESIEEIENYYSYMFI